MRQAEPGLIVVEPLPAFIGGEPDFVASVSAESLRTIKGDVKKRRYRKYDRPVRVRRSPRSFAERVDEIRTGHFEPLGPSEDRFGRPATIWGYFPAGWNKPKYRLTTGECLTSCNCPQGRRNIHCKHAELWQERHRKAVV